MPDSSLVTVVVRNKDADFTEFPDEPVQFQFRSKVGMLGGKCSVFKK